jgi:predicted Zn-ribbon and HTH transcriptional regulator
MKVECLECGKVFNAKTLNENTKCPKCKSHDLDLACLEIYKPKKHNLNSVIYE